MALARALVRRPQLLLLDEPFAALDAHSSQALRQVLRTLHQSWGTTTLLVSHHEIDVQTLANRVIRLVQGRIDLDRILPARPVDTPMVERIVSIEYDEKQQCWRVETTSTTLQSRNPIWSQRKVGDFIDG